MSKGDKEKLREALEGADLELDEEQLDDVAGGRIKISCNESCYEQCSACCYNGSANRLVEAPAFGAQ
jgi:hypothetical protein